MSTPAPVLAANPAPHSPIAPPNVVDRVSAFVKRFVFLKEPSLYRLLALWIIHTYLVDEFEYTGYVFAHSPEPESGKTRLLEVLEVLVENSSGILVSPSESVLFRTALGHTEFLDEVDTWTNKDQLRSVLNAGFQHGAQVQRMTEKKGNHKDYEVQKFSVFAPRALSGIGVHILPPATRSRTFAIEMVRRTRSERREKFRKRKIRPEAQQLINEIKTWTTEHKAAVAARYEGEFSYLDRFGERTADVSEPLAAILEVAYASSTLREAALLDLIEAIAKCRKEKGESIKAHRILSALNRLAEAENPVVGNPSELAERCGKYDVECSEYEVSQVIREYGFESKSIRREGESRRRYTLSHDELSGITARYLCGNEECESLAASIGLATA